MQPQQPPQLSPNPVPSDYLDQIATPQQKPGIDNKLFLVIIAGAVLLIVILAITIFSSLGGSKSVSTERLALRLQTLEKVSQDSQKRLASSALRSTNSNLRASLINANRDIATPLKAAEINLKKADKKLVAEENGTKLKAALEDARLNATFDRTYAKEMSYQLETTTILMNRLLATTKSTSLKTFLNASLKDLVSLQKQFSKYSSANS
jgi:hypothetical protein